MKSVFNRLSMLAATSALIMAQVIMPVHAAFATTGSKGPAGNNGTVKINDESPDEDSSNRNEPHLATCQINVRWYGFDEGVRTSTVTFTSQSPTAADQLVSPIGPVSANFTAPTRENGNTLSHEKNYTLFFKGTATHEGYHVKVTVHTDGSRGNDTKYKVVWVPATCTVTKPVTPESNPGPTSTPNPSKGDASNPAATSNPAAQATPVAKESALPAELPETGANFTFLIIGSIASALAYGATYFAQPKRLFN